MTGLFCLYCFFSCLSKTCLCYGTLYLYRLAYNHLPKELAGLAEERSSEITVAAALLIVGCSQLMSAVKGRKKALKCCRSCLSKNTAVKCVLAAAILYVVRVATNAVSDQLFTDGIKSHECSVSSLAAFLPGLAFYLIAGAVGKCDVGPEPVKVGPKTERFVSKTDHSNIKKVREMVRTFNRDNAKKFQQIAVKKDIKLPFLGELEGRFKSLKC